MTNGQPTQGENKNNLRDIQEKIKQSVNWIAVGLLCAVLVLISLFNVDGGLSIKSLPSTWYGWVLWAIMVFAPPTISVMILFTFRQEGIKQGHAIPEVKQARDNWIEAISKDKSARPRGLKEYLAKTTLKDAVTKFIMSAMLSVAVMSIAISGDLSGLVALVLQLLLALGFGMIKMFQATSYCSEELIVWYKLEVERIARENKEIENAEKMGVQDDG